jgi:hypothetical protein
MLFLTANADIAVSALLNKSSGNPKLTCSGLWKYESINSSESFALARISNSWSSSETIAERPAMREANLGFEEEPTERERRREVCRVEGERRDESVAYDESKDDVEWRTPDDVVLLVE